MVAPLVGRGRQWCWRVAEPEVARVAVTGAATVEEREAEQPVVEATDAAAVAKEEVEMAEGVEVRAEVVRVRVAAPLARVVMVTAMEATAMEGEEGDGGGGDGGGEGSGDTGGGAVGGSGSGFSFLVSPLMSSYSVLLNVELPPPIPQKSKTQSSYQVWPSSVPSRWCLQSSSAASFMFPPPTSARNSK